MKDFNEEELKKIIVSQKRRHDDNDEDEEDLLALGLGRTRRPPPSQTPSPPQPLSEISLRGSVLSSRLDYPQLPDYLISPIPPLFIRPLPSQSSTTTTASIPRPTTRRHSHVLHASLYPRTRRNANRKPKEGKSETVPVPFIWATNRRATVYSAQELFAKQIFSISGLVECRRCERQYEIEFDLRERFIDLWIYMAQNKNSLHDRAPSKWMNPILPSCRFCEQENVLKPIIAEKKKAINWLFLFLGQMLGCCTLEQLKYFCKHTRNHRTGAKDRVLYLTYLGLCKQLDPNGPFDR